MRFNSKEMKWLIPALALLIILESVLVVNNTELGRREIQEKIPFAKSTQTQEKAIISLVGEEIIELDQPSQVEVVLIANDKLFLDGVDVYINYDPSKVEVLGIDPSEKFSYVARNWIEPEEKRVLISMVEPSVMEGVEISAGEEVSLAVIEFKPLDIGRTDFNIYRSSEAKGTVLAGQGVEYSYSKKDLTVKVK
jgi:hypothetical protein